VAGLSHTTSKGRQRRSRCTQAARRGSHNRTMPPLRLTNLLEQALPGLSATSRAVVRTLACRNGAAPPAPDVAAWVGARDRFQLARCLRRDGLPPLTELAGWTRVLYWMLEAETTGASLFQLAQREHLDPAVA